MASLMMSGNPPLMQRLFQTQVQRIFWLASCLQPLRSILPLLCGDYSAELHTQVTRASGQDPLGSTSLGSL